MSKIKSVTLNQTNLYQEANRRYQELLQIKKIKEASVAKAPPEKIRIIDKKSFTQFYLRIDKEDTNGKYLAKSEIPKIKLYMQKAYDEKILKLVKQEVQILEAFLRKSGDIDQNIQQVYSSYPNEVKKYVTPIDMSDEDFQTTWQSIPYEPKAIPDYLPLYETKRKERVRSKSELNIANALADMGIPYKYECPLLLKNGVVIHPDFTVLDVRQRREIYWEHRGMMDEKDYARNSVSRLKTYVQNGIFPGNELITTEETSTNPLGTNEIYAVIKKYLVN